LFIIFRKVFYNKVQNIADQNSKLDREVWYYSIQKMVKGL